jgi:hypothetical protein
MRGVVILYYVACFFAGLFVCNGIPHLVCGLRGEPFPTPFSKPPGRGHSSALVNFFWGASNLIAGVILLLLVPFVPGFNPGTAVFTVAFLIMGIPTSTHFEKVRLGRKDGGEK